MCRWRSSESFRSKRSKSASTNFSEVKECGGNLQSDKWCQKHKHLQLLPHANKVWVSMVEGETYPKAKIRKGTRFVEKRQKLSADESQGPEYASKYVYQKGARHEDLKGS